MTAELLAAVRAAQAEYVDTGDAAAACERLLGSLLELTGSELGLIAELPARAGPPRWLAAADRRRPAANAWDAEPWRTIRERLVPDTVRAGARRRATADRSLLGIPVLHGAEVAGVIALAGGPDDAALDAALAPLVTTCAVLLEARRRDRRQLEAERRLDGCRHAAALERFAGAIAHDFNNTLTAVLGHAELLARIVDRGEDHAADLDAIVAAARRGRALARRLGGLAGADAAEPEALVLGRVARDLAPLLRRLLPESIALEVVAEDGGATVLADRRSLEQALLDLAAAARDAMPRGGRLRIHTRLEELDGDSRPEGFATLHARGGDAGPAVDLRLPLLDPSPQPGEPAAAVRGAARVLLAMDDPVARGTLAGHLRGHGYEVAAAVDGDDALAALARLGSVDVLVADLDGPDLDGPELARQARALVPAAGVLLVADDPAGEPTTADAAGVLAKPIDAGELLRAVAELVACAHR